MEHYQCSADLASHSLFLLEVWPPGPNKENSFLEGLHKSFVDILSVNSVNEWHPV